ncbi:hypothetical protein VIPARAQ4037_0690 [Vibrio parahaemolyticus AQ4037]|nr:hypothetical protein VIPARAQ4037_0690 [Vibrio parahaemolyticus AQ4037]
MTFVLLSFFIIIGKGLPWSSIRRIGRRQELLNGYAYYKLEPLKISILLLV